MSFTHSIFALELCLQMVPGDPLRASLQQLIELHPAWSSPQEKWRLYRSVSELLGSRLGYAVSGCWDFFDNDQRALEDYNMWCGGMTTLEGARRWPSGPADPYRGDHRYMTFTMSLLLQHGTPSERAFSSVCEVAEPDLWKRATFARLLASVGMISFASVKSDVIYLIPRDETFGLTAEDLRAPKFEYLRPLG
jgi:hypothetical protein